MFLRADEHEVRVFLDDGVNTPNGVVDARGLFLDVGRLEPGDPRAGAFNDGRDADKWPKPGEELIVRDQRDRGDAAGRTARPSSRSRSSRGDTTVRRSPSPATSADAIYLATCQARPARAGTTSSFAALKARSGSPTCGRAGQGFDLDINRRVDTDRWLEVTGTVVREKGLVSLKATRVSLSKAPQVSRIR